MAIILIAAGALLLGLAVGAIGAIALFNYLFVRTLAGTLGW